MKLDDVKCVAATPKAICVTGGDLDEIVGDGEEVWIPQSQVDDDSEVCQKGDVGVLIVSDWIANEKGWT